MVPFLLWILTLFWNDTIFVEDFWPFSEMVPFLLRNFDSFPTEMVPFLLTIFDPLLKWYNFCWGILTLFWNGTIFVENLWPSSEMVPFLLRNFDPFLKWYLFVEELLIMTVFLTEMIPFLSRFFDPFLKWYHFCWQFVTLFWNGSIFVEEFWPFSEMVPFRRGIMTFFLTEMIPFLFRIFDPFLKWYHFCWRFLTQKSCQNSSTKMVPFLKRFVASLNWVLQIWCSDFRNFDFWSFYGCKTAKNPTWPPFFGSFLAIKWPKNKISKIATLNL